MIEGRHWLSLDARRYIEVVGVHGDGRPRMHISEDLCLRFNARLDLHQKHQRREVHDGNVPTNRK